MSSLKPTSTSSRSNKKCWTASSSSSTMAGVGRAGFIRDPSGLLMSIIRTLSASDGDHQREVEKERLEEAFIDTDEKLDKLINENYEEVAMSIKKFSRIADEISRSREKIKKVKENLQQCKSLLYCRQDELRKLWTEGIEHNKMLFLLDQIEKIKVAPHQIDSYLKDKYYLHATVLINQTLNSLRNELSKVESLHDIGHEIVSKKLGLYDNFVNELHQLIYFKSFSASKKSKSDDKKPNRLVNLSSFNLLSQSSSKEIGIFDEVVETLEDLDSKSNKVDPKSLITILIESLNRINRIPSMLQDTKNRMDRHISMIISHTTVEVADQYFNTDGSVKTNDIDGSKRLLQLLNTLFIKFKLVADFHLHVLNQIKGLVTSGRLQPCGDLYEMDMVWNKIQNFLQILLNEYLDADSVQASTQQQQQSNDNSVISSHFTKKRAQQRSLPQNKLFRFDRSSHAISMNNYLREQRAQLRHAAISSGTQSSPILEHAMSTQKVCQPNARNITSIFGPLKSFIADIEAALDYPPNRHCAINEFITNFVKDTFIRHIQCDLKKDFDAAMRVTEPLKMMADPSICKELGTTKSLLQGATVADHCLWYLFDLTCSLDSYQDDFLAMACSLTQEYKAVAEQLYKGVVLYGPEGSAPDWLTSSELNEYLRNSEGWRVVNGLLPSSTKPDDKPLEKSYSNEAKYFVYKSSSLDLNSGGIISDVNDLRSIACLHESVEWMSERLERFVKRVAGRACDDMIARLSNLSDDFLRISEECLLMLHIQLRLNCCRKIKDLFKQANFDVRGADSVDPDLSISLLTADLRKFQEQIMPVLEPHKFKYIIDGLGHLVAELLIDGSRLITRISPSGIKKMCRNVFSLQQCLTNITLSREAPLDMSRQYYELMYLASEDIQPHILEHGIKFSESAYVEALNLIHRSKPGSGQENERNARVQRLRAIVSEQQQKKERQEELSSLDDVEI